MKMQKKNNFGGLVIAVKHRKSGSMVRDNKTITWNERFQVVLISFEGENERAIRKYSINPQHEKKILQTLDAIHWACLVELDLENGEIVELTVVEDVLKDFYEREIEL